MDSPAKAKRPNYSAVLDRRAQEIFETINEELSGSLNAHANIREYIRNVLKETALESFKNGIEVGRKPRPGKPAATGKRP
jgi:hypothetical protein